eukprot:1160104-Pelagomonas_calceolata.AAC.17
MAESATGQAGTSTWAMTRMISRESRDKGAQDSQMLRGPKGAFMPKNPRTYSNPRQRIRIYHKQMRARSASLLTAALKSEAREEKGVCTLPQAHICVTCLAHLAGAYFVPDLPGMTDLLSLTDTPGHCLLCDRSCLLSTTELD